MPAAIKRNKRSSHEISPAATKDLKQENIVHMFHAVFKCRNTASQIRSLFPVCRIPTDGGLVDPELVFNRRYVPFQLHRLEKDLNATSFVSNRTTEGINSDLV